MKKALKIKKFPKKILKIVKCPKEMSITKTSNIPKNPKNCKTHQKFVINLVNSHCALSPLLREHLPFVD